MDTEAWVESLGARNCINFARSTPYDELPTLLRRIANDLASLPSYRIVGMHVELLDTADMGVFLSFESDDPESFAHLPEDFASLLIGQLGGE